jgi:hypothetical protein
MRRREFIEGLGGAVAWPVAVQAQQVPFVGMLTSIRKVPPRGEARGLCIASFQGCPADGCLTGRHRRTYRMGRHLARRPA